MDEREDPADRVDVRAWAADHTKGKGAVGGESRSSDAELKPSSPGLPAEPKPTGFASAGWDNPFNAGPNTETPPENSPTHDRDRPDVSGPHSSDSGSDGSDGGGL